MEGWFPNFNIFFDFKDPMKNFRTLANLLSREKQGGEKKKKEEKSCNNTTNVQDDAGLCYLHFSKAFLWALLNPITFITYNPFPVWFIYYGKRWPLCKFYSHRYIV